MKDDSSYSILIDLYIFAEKKMTPGLQNDTIDALIRLDDAAIFNMGSLDINRVWHHTAESSKLRRLAIDQFVRTADFEFCFNWAKNGLEAHDADFVRQVAVGYWVAHRGSEAKTSADSEAYFDFELWEHRCRRYHTHQDAKSLCEGSL